MRACSGDREVQRLTSGSQAERLNGDPLVTTYCLLKGSKILRIGLEGDDLFVLISDSLAKPANCITVVCAAVDEYFPVAQVNLCWKELWCGIDDLTSEVAEAQSELPI